jgi:hypothetical protein
MVAVYTSGTTLAAGQAIRAEYGVLDESWLIGIPASLMPAKDDASFLQAASCSKVRPVNEQSPLGLEVVRSPLSGVGGGIQPRVRCGLGSSRRLREEAVGGGTRMMIRLVKL